jgi:hypothetical protein
MKSWLSIINVWGINVLTKALIINYPKFSTTVCLTQDRSRQSFYHVPSQWGVESHFRKFIQLHQNPYSSRYFPRRCHIVKPCPFSPERFHYGLHGTRNSVKLLPQHATESKYVKFNTCKPASQWLHITLIRIINSIYIPNITAKCHHIHFREVMCSKNTLILVSTEEIAEVLQKEFI